MASLAAPCSAAEHNPRTAQIRTLAPETKAWHRTLSLTKAAPEPQTPAEANRWTGQPGRNMKKDASNGLLSERAYSKEFSEFIQKDPQVNPRVGERINCLHSTLHLL